MDAAATDGEGLRPARGGRTTAFLGLLAALAVLASWWLPWFALDRDGTGRLGQAAREELEARRAEGRAVTAEADLVAGVARAAEAGAIRGTDLAAWFDAMARARTDLAPEAPDLRRFRAIARTVQGLAVAAGALVLLYLLALGRGVGALALGGSVALGVIATATGLLVRALVEETGGRGLEAVGLGGHGLLAGGALLVVVGLLGVTRATWWKAWLFALLGLAGVAAWAMTAYALRP